MQPSANHLLDTIRNSFSIKNDADLARALGIAPPIISKMRKGVAEVSPGTLIAMHEVFEMPISDLKDLAGIIKRAPRS